MAPKPPTPTFRRSVAAVAVVVFAGLLGGLPPERGPGPRPEADRRVPRAAGGVAGGRLGALPLRFEPNAGQFGTGTSFVARPRGYRFALSRDGAAFRLIPPGRGRRGVDFRFHGAAATQPVGVRRLPGVTNYLLGDDPAGWHTGVPGFGSVRAPRIYPGIDAVFRENDERELEFDFVVEPGSDPGAISIEVSGGNGVRIDEAGSLVVPVPGGAVRFKAPHLYQGDGPARRTVEGAFVQLGPTRVGFRVGPYDRTRPLVIDPVLVYSTYLGGSVDEVGSGVAVGHGGIYVVGTTASGDFPTRNALMGEYQGDHNSDLIPILGDPPDDVFIGDAFVTKFTPDGSELVFSTYLGGGGQDGATGIALDSEAVYVTGITSSAEFPTQKGTKCVDQYPKTEPLVGDTLEANEGFLVKLTPEGDSILFGTCLGVHLLSYDVEVHEGVAYLAGIDDNNALIDDIQQTDCASFVGRVDTGSTQPSLELQCIDTGPVYDLARSPLGFLYVTGGPSVTEEPDENKERWFVERLPESCIPDCDKQIGAFTSWTSGDTKGQARAIAVHHTPGTSDQIYVTGFRSQPAGSFIAKLTSRVTGTVGDWDILTNPGRNETGHCPYPTRTTVGRCGTGVAVDPAGNAYFVGVTSDPGHSTTPDAIQETLNGRMDAWLMKVDPSGNQLFSTFLGGSGHEGLAGNDLGAFGVSQGISVAVDDAGDIYMAGTTSSVDFPIVGAPQDGFGGGPSDAFLLRVSLAAPSLPVVTGLIPSGGPPVGGTPVTISGSGFLGATAVHFGGTALPCPGAACRVEADGDIRVVSPPGGSGLVYVTVEGTGGRSLPSGGARFTYGEGLWGPATGSDDHDPKDRFGHTSTLLTNGRILVAGGQTLASISTITKTVVAYDPLEGSWEALPEMTTPRSGHTATLLKDGRVLVVGGLGNLLSQAVGGSLLIQAEIYDPADPASGWTNAGPPRTIVADGHSATLLQEPGCADKCGMVLVLSEDDANLFDPDTGQWLPTGAPAFARKFHSAVRLGNGKVLAAGGEIVGCVPLPECRNRTVAPAEIYDPATGLWTRPAGDMANPTVYSAAGPLGSGSVLVSGGRQQVGGRSTAEASPPLSVGPSATAELFDPETGLWSASLMDRARFMHSQTVLPDGRALVVGGCLAYAQNETVDCRGGVETAEIFTPRPGGGAWMPAAGRALRASQVHNRRGATSTLLGSDPFAPAYAPAICGSHCGKVLVTGGGSPAELFTPPPSVSALAPAIGSVAGGTRVAVEGTGFTNGPLTVRFGSGPAIPCPGPDCTVDSFSRLTVLAPAAVKGTVPVVVTGPGGASAQQPEFAFTGLPDTITDLAARALSASEIEISFTAPDDGTGSAPATQFEIRRSGSPLTEASFDSAPLLCRGACGLAPSAPGDRAVLAVGGVEPATTHHLAVRAIGFDGAAGPVSNSAAATTPALGTARLPPPAAGSPPPAGPPSAAGLPATGCPAAPQASGAVAYPPGYSLVGLPGGTRVPAQSPLYSWANRGSGSNYGFQDPSEPVAPGLGYWAWFACPTSVPAAGGAPSVRLDLAGLHASMVGNPSGRSRARVTGQDYAARWDPRLNNGAGGYHISTFRQPQSLAVGEGMWAFAFRPTTIVITEQ